MQRKTACLIVPCSPGTALRKLEAVLRFFYRKLLSTQSGSFSIHRFFFAAMLLYMLFLRLDPGRRSNCWFHDAERQKHPYLFFFSPHSSSVFICVDFQTVPAAQTGVEGPVCTLLSGCPPQQRTVELPFSGQNKTNAHLVLIKHPPARYYFLSNKNLNARVIY